MNLFDLNPDVRPLMADAERFDRGAVDLWNAGSPVSAAPVAAARTVVARACRVVGIRFLAVASALGADERPLPGPVTR